MFSMEDLADFASYLNDQKYYDGQGKLQPVARGQKVTTANVATLSTNLLYGQGGLFDPCVPEALINASTQGHGIAEWLRWVGTTVEMRHQGLITELRQLNAPDLEDLCADPPVPKFGACEIIFCLGRIVKGSQQYDLFTAGTRNCEANPRYRFRGALTDQFGNAIFPMNSQINNDAEWGAVQAATILDQDLCRMMWIGDPGNLSLSPEEFKGLSQHLVQTGYVDITSNTPCSAVDSEVKDFGGNCICDDATPAAFNIYAYVAALKQNADTRARVAGLGAIDWQREAVIVANHSLLSAMYDCWPCVTTGPCAGGLRQIGGAAANLTVINSDAIEQAARFRRDGYLTVDGVDIPTLADDCIPVTRAGETEVSSVFLLVRTIAGMPILFGEYQDLNATSGGVLRSLMNFNLGTKYRITDGGRFVTWFETKNQCFDVRIGWRGRIALLAPQLQGRIDNVCWQPVQHSIDVMAPTGIYGVDGGRQRPLAQTGYDDCFGIYDLS